MTAEFVVAQLQAVLSDYGATAVKTGFIGRADLIEAIAAQLKSVQFGERAYLQHQSVVNSVSFSLKDEILAIYSDK